MKYLLYFPLFVFVFFIHEKSYCQNDYPKETVRLESDIWLGTNIQISPNQWNDIINPDSSFVSKNVFLIQALGKHTTMEMTNTDFFYQKSLYLSYERQLSPKWVGGLSYRYSEININKNTIRLHLRHFSPIKKIDLILWQQVAFERILSNNSFYDPVSRLRFQLAANKYFSISNKKLISTISFELFKEIQRIDPNSERRFFQEQRIQTEWLFPIYKNIYLGAFAGLHTRQFIALAQFNMEGEELKPTRRLNQQIPTFGIQAMLTLGENNIPNRRVWID